MTDASLARGVTRVPYQKLPNGKYRSPSGRIFTKEQVAIIEMDKNKKKKGKR